MKNLIYILTISMLLACQDKRNFYFPKVKDFHFINAKDYSTDSIAFRFNFISKIQNLDKTIDLTDTIYQQANLVDYHSYKTNRTELPNREKVNVYINTTNLLAIESFPSSEIFYNGYAAYFVNETDHSILVDKFESGLIFIQEAQDEKGKWKPIEFWQSSGCGNSYSGIILKPNDLIMVKIFKYNGSFKTNLRIKMRNGNFISYSKPYTGSINLTQFDTTLVNRNFSNSDFLMLENQQ